MHGFAQLLIGLALMAWTFLRSLWGRRGVAAESAPPLLAAPRSRYWPAVELKAFDRDGHRCRACGVRSHLVGHHVAPFHVEPARELDLTNVLTLCQPAGGGCHLNLGHTDKQGRRGWQYWNPDAVADAAKRRREAK